MTDFKDQNTTTAAPTDEALPAQQSIKGQSAFHVELSPVGVVVRTVFVGENADLHVAPAAVFANVDMAIHQLDELKRLVLRQFGEAAFIGLQALQQAQQPAAEASEVATQGATS